MNKEKITHEQVRESVEMVDGSFFPTEKEALLTYINQQEQLDEYLRISYDRDIKAYSEIRKLNKLLELYRELAHHTRPIIIDDKYVELQQKIKELENEKEE